MTLTGRKKSAVYAARRGDSHPTGAEATPYLQAAVTWATEHLTEAGIKPPRHPHGLLYRYLTADRRDSE